MKFWRLRHLQTFLRYHDLPGDLPARVYLHGLGGSSSADYPRALAHPALRGTRSLLVDLLGHGFSDKPFEFGYSLEEHAGTVAELLDDRRLQGCTVIGHSMGGAVAVTLAALRPDLVSRLALAEGFLEPREGSVSAAVAAQTEEEFVTNGYGRLVDRMLASGVRGDSAAAAYVGALQTCAPHAFYRTAVGMVRGTRPRVRARLTQSVIPRAYIFGERSLPHPDWDELPRWGVRTLLVRDAEHHMMVDNPEGFAETLQAALTG